MSNFQVIEELPEHFIRQFLNAIYDISPNFQVPIEKDFFTFEWKDAVRWLVQCWFNREAALYGSFDGELLLCKLVKHVKLLRHLVFSIYPKNLQSKRTKSAQCQRSLKRRHSLLCKYLHVRHAGRLNRSVFERFLAWHATTEKRVQHGCVAALRSCLRGVIVGRGVKFRTMICAQNWSRCGRASRAQLPRRWNMECVRWPVLWPGILLAIDDESLKGSVFLSWVYMKYTI